MFRPFSLAIFRLINETFSKQLHSTSVGCIQWGGKRWIGYEISHVLCRMGGVGTWVLLAEPMYPHHPSYTRQVYTLQSSRVTKTTTLKEKFVKLAEDNLPG